MNNGLHININKYSQITFTRHNKNIISQYYINNCKLNIVTTIKWGDSGHIRLFFEKLT